MEHANCGGQSETGAIRRLFLKHARDAFVSRGEIARQWEALNYASAPNLERAIEEYDRFADLLAGLEIDVRFLPLDERVGLDSIYVRDAAVVCDKGVVLCNPAKPPRRLEPPALEASFRALGIPIHGAISGEARVEGGDVVWLGPRTLAVGLGYRTDERGIEQLRSILAECVDELITVPLPHWRGPRHVLHLMSILSPLDEDLALVYSPLLPVPFREWLIALGIRLVEVPDDEFETLGTNALAVAPRRCILLSGNPRTKRRLEEVGVEVLEYDGSEISRKGAGGPTCLTRPILRGA